MPKFTTKWARLPYEAPFKAGIREFADRFFKVVAWTIYVSVLLGLYLKTKNTLFFVIAVFGHALIAGFIWSFVSDLQNYIIERSHKKDRWWFQLPTLIAAAAIWTTGAWVSLQIAGELVVFGR